MTKPPYTDISPLRHAALTGLRYAADLIDYLGWEPCAPGTHLHLWAHLNVAAGKTGPQHGEHPQDVQGLMANLLAQLVETDDVHGWEAEPGRTAAEVAATLRAAAHGSVAVPAAA